MMIYTHIDIPDDVYKFFLKEAQKHPGQTPEDAMSRYLTRNARRTAARREAKATQLLIDLSAPSTD